MIELKDIQNIYFIGAGGIGMSAIERYFISRGVVVNGYDKTENVFTKQLVSEGFKNVARFAPAFIAKQYLECYDNIKAAIKS